MSDTIENRMAEVLVAHQRHGVRACLCGWDALGKSHAAHQADMTAPLIREAQKHERHHVIQEIRETADHESPQIGDYGRVELEGYYTISDGELETIEGSTGNDRMCMTDLEWDAGVVEAQAVALEEAARTFHHDSIAAQAQRARAAKLRGQA